MLLKKIPAEVQIPDKLVVTYIRDAMKRRVGKDAAMCLIDAWTQGKSVSATQLRTVLFNLMHDVCRCVLIRPEHHDTADLPGGQCSKHPERLLIACFLLLDILQPGDIVWRRAASLCIRKRVLR